MTDYLLHIIGHAYGVAGNGESVWRIKFTDGETKTGRIQHLGGSAYLLVREDPIYFNSAHVSRLTVDQ